MLLVLLNDFVHKMTYVPDCPRPGPPRVEEANDWSHLIKTLCMKRVDAKPPLFSTSQAGQNNFSSLKRPSSLLVQFTFIKHSTLPATSVLTPQSQTTTHLQTIQTSVNMILHHLTTMVMALLTNLACASPMEPHKLVTRGYPLRCNSDAIHKDHRVAVIKNLKQKSGSQLVRPHEGAHVAEHCHTVSNHAVFVYCAHVTVYSFPDDGQHEVAYTAIADGVANINDVCGERGGSVEVPGNKNVVVHLSAGRV